MPDSGAITNYFAPRRQLCRSSDFRVNRPRHTPLPVRLHSRLAVRMSSRAKLYRLRGLVAQRWAAQATERPIRDTFEDVAEGWFQLAEQAELCPPAVSVIQRG